MAIESAAVVGAGTMGTGIAMSLVNAGIAVYLADASPAVLERGRASIEHTYASSVERGRMSQAEGAERLARITTTPDPNRMRTVDLIIEAVFEDMATKRDVFAELGASARPDAMLATNTSTLDVDEIASAAPNPQRTLGLHFFSPAHVMRLLEVVRGAATSAETVAGAVALAQRIGKVPVVVGNCDGFVGNRMLLRYRREAEFALERGATPAEVDGALQGFGFAMGPFAVADLAGIDIGWRAKQEREKRGGLPFRVSDIPDRMVEAGRLGQKTGAGYYRYDVGSRTPRPDRAVDEILARERERLAIRTASPSSEEIVARCLAALINEGARILDDGIAARSDDIDTIWRTGYGFPAERGGPMAYADASGLDRVLAAIQRYGADDPQFWQPAPLLERLVSERRKFSSLSV